ncbi:MAG: alpha/beta hydrolase family protein [Planctomycetota bacterium]
MSVRPLLALPFLLVALSAQEPGGYRTPPEPILSLVTAEPSPGVSLSPCRRWLVLLHEEAMPDLEVLARPHLKLAGLRIDPETHGRQLGTRTTRVVLRTPSDRAGRELGLPKGHLGGPYWSADGERAAFTHTTGAGIELWIVDTATAAARKIAAVKLNMVLGSALEWSRDQRSLLVKLVTDTPLPPAPAAPAGPNVQETEPGRRAQVRTNQDMLQSEYDAQCFEALGRAQLARVRVADGQLELLGEPALLAGVEESPDGAFLLVSTIQRPFSYLVSYRDFPTRTEVWSRTGERVRTVAETPLEEATPIGGVPTGPRGIRWLDGHGHALSWVEALDGGNPRAKAEQRDRILVLTDLAGEPREWLRTRHRAFGISGAADGRLGLLNEFDRNTRTIFQWRVDLGDFAGAPVKIDERSSQDAYGDPGRPIAEALPDGQRLLRQRGALLYRSGRGASPDGDRPFLDSWNPVTDETVRLWQCAEGRYETFVGFLSDDAILIRSEAEKEPPNYVAVELASGARTAITDFRDPAQEFAQKVQKELIRYQRADGVALSGTLYLPPGHRDGQTHPTLVWAYPQEFRQASDAGQVRSAPTRYVRFAGTSPLWLLLAGYAVFDDAAMPIVGPVRTANDTYVEQLVADARAAVDILVERGVADRHRIAIAGHSYGAFMAANLLCHSDLFAAGIARSGAYNRSLTPFGFQNEERTFWEAPEIYLAMSPFAHADELKAPLLLIHGEDDDNQGTWPLQSQRLFAAVKGHGGHARLVMLPHESHGYRARQSVLHCLSESIEWLDRHVKNREVPAEASTAK